MDIVTTFQNGRWITDPDPAIVALGTKVRWVVRAPELSNRSLKWEIKFHGIPFGEDHVVLRVATTSSRMTRRTESENAILEVLGLTEDAAVNHRGVTDEKSADRSGDYKYDLSVSDAATGEQIGDDDPRLIVVRGILTPTEIFVF